MEAGKAVIFLSGSRNTTQNDIYRSHHTLSENSEYDKSFFNLEIFNDETLAAGAAIKHKIIPDSTAIVIPMVGDIVTNKRLSPGQLQIVHSDVSISNPYEYDLVNFLYIELMLLAEKDQSADFDIDANINRLVQLCDDLYLYMGKFEGRRDTTFVLRENTRGVFVFAIEGVFEVQGRLLHPRDGLALWELKEIEFEALSNDAILMVIEVQDADQVAGGRLKPDF